MTQGPTTDNGPLHTPEATLDDRSMTATFRSTADAESARAALLAAGFAENSVTLAGAGHMMQRHEPAALAQLLLELLSLV